MRRQQSNPSLQNDHLRHQALQRKLNQSLLTQSYFFLFVLIVLALLVNTARGYDYNVVVGCGIYFLSTKNPLMYRMFYFYMLVGLTMLADGIVITLLYGKVSTFHWLIAPVVSIILKLILLIFEGLRWLKQSKQEKQRTKNLQQTQSKLRKQIQQRRAFQNEQSNYIAQKRDKTVNPSNYYLPKKHYGIQQNFNTEAFKEFDHQQFIEEDQQNNQGARR